MIVRTPSPSVALRLLKVHVVLPTEAAFVFSCPVWSPLSLTQKVSLVVLTTSVSGAPFFAYRLPLATWVPEPPVRVAVVADAASVGRAAGGTICHTSPSRMAARAH